MTTTPTDTGPNGATTALANREFTDAQLRTRLELAQRNFGLERANPAQLNVLFLLCQRWQLDPLSDITLYEGRPWITLDGRVRLMLRHPEYRGYACRPLGREEKEAWGYEVDDIVVECIVRTSTWGEISARGKVSAAEVRTARDRAAETNKRPAPIGVHPVEIAEKRAIARAERAAFGQDAFPDEEEAQLQVIEASDPERVRANARRQVEIFGTEADWDGPPMAIRSVDTTTGEVVDQARPVAGSPSRQELFTENRRLVALCQQRGLEGGPTLNVRSAESAIASANAELRARLEEHARVHGDGPPPDEEFDV